MSSPNSDAISLPRFVELYSNALPLTVRVKAGSGISPQEPNCERLSILQANCSQVVAAETIEGDAFFLPLNTATRLSLLYNPTGDIKEAVQGFVFKTAADLKEISPRPMLVCTKTSWKDPDRSDYEESLLDANEILILLEDGTNAEGHSGLRVFSMNTRSTKFLPDNCSPLFSTAGSRLPLHLPDILAYVPRPFPCEACIFNEQSNRCYAANVVALTTLTTATVLRCVGRQGEQGASPVFYHVPVNLPGVEVVVEGDGDKCKGTAPTKDALTGELTGQLSEESSYRTCQLQLMGGLSQSTSQLIGAITCARDSAKCAAVPDPLYETIPDLPARCGQSKSLERSCTANWSGSSKVRNLPKLSRYL